MSGAAAGSNPFAGPLSQVTPIVPAEFPLAAEVTVHELNHRSRLRFNVRIPCTVCHDGAQASARDPPPPEKEEKTYLTPAPAGRKSREMNLTQNQCSLNPVFSEKRIPIS